MSQTTRPPAEGKKKNIYGWKQGTTSKLLLAALEIGVPEKTNSKKTDQKNNKEFFNKLASEYNKTSPQKPATLSQVKARWARLNSDKLFGRLHTQVCNCKGSVEEKHDLKAYIQALFSKHSSPVWSEEEDRLLLTSKQNSTKQQCQEAVEAYKELNNLI